MLKLSTRPSIRLLIQSCKTLCHLQQFHAHIICRGLEQDHWTISNILKLLTSLSASLSYSTSVFNRVIAPSTLLYNVLLKGYSRNSRSRESFLLYTRMKKSDSASPDEYTLSSLLTLCSRECKLREGQIVHGSAIRYGVAVDMFVGSGLIDFYGKCTEMISADKVFDEMPDRNVVCWTALVAGYANAGDMGNARNVFGRMPVRNSVSWTAMIIGLVKTGDIVGARKWFDEMPRKNVVDYTVLIDGYAKSGDMASAMALFESCPEKDIVAWSALISGFAQNGMPKQALEMFKEMESGGVKPDEFIVVSLMSACAQIGSLDLAKSVDYYLSETSIDACQAHVMAALIGMNARCGNMARAEVLFNRMPQHDLITYCSMIKGYSIDGRGDQAIELFYRMLDEGLVPDEVAFTVILSACSRAGLVEEGWNFFTTLTDKYSLVPTPDHYACMVDLLSKAGRLEAAYQLLVSCPLEPYACAWGALLGASSSAPDLWFCPYGEHHFRSQVRNAVAFTVNHSTVKKIVAGIFPEMELKSSAPMVTRKVCTLDSPTSSGSVSRDTIYWRATIAVDAARIRVKTEKRGREDLKREGIHVGAESKNLLVTVSIGSDHTTVSNSPFIINPK
ncbi:unnamed protein product [Linum tenue]|uniref:Uncharacterized protein n=1 Tax=Linum tenue TaxID=586396 RepID=A0AAV0LAV2_9ROSI|nr:unnamed protein product [Linum tenue]